MSRLDELLTYISGDGRPRRLNTLALDFAEREYWTDLGTSRHNLEVAIAAYLAAMTPTYVLTSKIELAARALFDNRLGWSNGRKPYASRDLWADLGAAFYGETDARVQELRRPV